MYQEERQRFDLEEYSCYELMDSGGHGSLSCNTGHVCCCYCQYFVLPQNVYFLEDDTGSRALKQPFWIA